MGVPPAASTLIGRDAELAALDVLCAQTAGGAGGIVLLAGEPGVGKTRLAREAAGRASGLGVSWGACRESMPPACTRAPEEIRCSSPRASACSPTARRRALRCAASGR